MFNVCHLLVLVVFLGTVADSRITAMLPVVWAALTPSWIASLAGESWANWFRVVTLRSIIMRLNRADISVAFVSIIAIVSIIVIGLVSATVIVVVVGLASIAPRGVAVNAQLMKLISGFGREQSILGISVVVQLDLIFFNLLSGLRL